MARYGFWFWATVLVELATLFVILKVLYEIAIWILSFLAKFGPMDILYVFWIIAAVIILTVGSICIALVYAFDLMNLDFDGNWLGAQQVRVMQSPLQILDWTKDLVILDVLIQALLKPYWFKGFFDNVILTAGGQSEPILD
jgi:hypothetical protein